MNGSFFRTTQTLRISTQLQRPSRKEKLIIKDEYVTAANVEVDQQTAFEGSMKLFRRESNNSNVVNEMKRRRYHEEAWMMRRRKEKERTMKAKFPRNIMTFDDKNPLADNTIFAQEYGNNELLLNSRRNKRAKPGLGYEKPHGVSAKREGSGPGNLVTSESLSQRPYRRTVTINDSATLGRTVGYKGATLKAMESRTGTRMVFRTMGENDYHMMIDGEPDNVAAAEELLQKVIKEGPAANGLPRAPEGFEKYNPDR